MRLVGLNELTKGEEEQKRQRLWMRARKARSLDK